MSIVTRSKGSPVIIVAFKHGVVAEFCGDYM